MNSARIQPFAADPGSSALRGDAGALRVAGLERRFGGRRAIAGVDFSLGAGDCLCVLGPNGAGKTTLLRVLAGLLRPTAGTVVVAGRPLTEGGDVRRLCGLISHGSMLYGALTARENLEFTARLHGVKSPSVAAAAALERMGAERHARTPVRLLSRGQQQRVSIARALVHGPSVLLLDEPYSGLDETGARRLTEVLTSLRGDGAALLVVTHNVAEGISLATDYAIMLRGRFASHASGGPFDAASVSRQYSEMALQDG